VAQDIAEAAEMVGLKRVGPIPLPTRYRKFALLRSPFKHHRSFEHFEIRTHKRLIWIEGTPQQVQRFVRFATDSLEPIAAIRVREHNYHRVGAYYVEPSRQALSLPPTAASALQQARAAAMGSSSMSSDGVASA